MVGTYGTLGKSRRCNCPIEDPLPYSYPQVAVASKLPLACLYVFIIQNSSFTCTTLQTCAYIVDTLEHCRHEVDGPPSATN